ncbi:hypothetical protein GH714_026050 [Hevea brasiliensis]|uniref:RNase H type-1 domain-containing protein n=1 Tax=Hevea brasiliensis TaxID=3981 RepID=A0A6A6NJ60_HEVBR|nr:hypothetical protein GH714_026050 [Hevea brasiliensis]
METKIGRDKVERIKRAVGYDGSFVVNPVGLRGGLALFWKYADLVRLLSYSRNHIDVEVLVDGFPQHRFTGFMDFLKVIDVENLGSFFRVCILSLIFPGVLLDAYVETLVATNSDHSPLFLCLNTTLVVYHKKRFCFENSWSFEEECRGVIEEGWQKQVLIPNDVRIQHVCARLKDWGDKQRDRFKHSPNTNAHDREEICSILSVAETDSHGSYLGLPIVVGRNKTDVFNFVVDKYPPVEGFIECNIDGANGPNQSAIAWLCRDSSGGFMSCHARPRQVIFEPLICEAIGVREVLSWLKENHTSHAYVETDSQLVVQAMNNVIVVLVVGQRIKRLMC